MNAYDPGANDERRSLSDLTVGVWGLGKMGMPLACVLADHGATVRGVDIDSTVVERVNEGIVPIENEPGMSDLLERYGGDRLEATDNGAVAAKEVDVAIVLVPTVLDDDHEPDMAPLVAAAEDIARGLEPGNLVVLESTVPPGTTSGLFRDRLESSGLQAGVDFGLAFCPERTSSGRVVRDLTESYPKIVGGIDEESTAAAAHLYRQFNEPGVVTMDGPTAAEAVKVFEGVYRDVNIALANELAKACAEWGLDAADVFDAANSQPYCDIHDPGVGVGGHCIPVYPHFVVDRASETPLVETARAVNDDMPAHTVGLLETKLAEHGIELSEARVLVLGLTYRPGVNELRYAPALDVIDHLLDASATVYAHDPLVDDETIEETGAIPIADPIDADEIDGVILTTGHETYDRLDTSDFEEILDAPVIIDGRDFFDAEQLATFDVTGVGRPE